MSKFKPVSITPIIPEKTFRAFVQTVLPTIYDDSLSYYELLNKAVKILNTNTENVAILSENQEKFIEEVTNYINSLEISIVPYDIALNFDVDTFDEMKATIANGGICCIALLDTDGSKNYLYYSNDRYYSDSNQNKMTFNGLTNIKNADDYSDNNAPSIITLSLEKVNDAIVVSYSKKYKVATEHDIDTAFANAIAISVQTYVFSYNVDSDTLSASDVTRDIVGAINNNRICVCKVVEENKPDVECYYSGRNSVNNAEKLVFVGNIIDSGVCIGTKTVNIDADADAFIVEGVTSVNDKYYADKDIIKFIDFDSKFENNELVLVNYTSPNEVYNYYRNDANKEFCVPRLRIINDTNEIIQEYYCFNSNIQNPNVANPSMNHMTFTFYIANDFTGYESVEISGRANSDSWLFMVNTEYNRRILPEVTSADNGKSLAVKNGVWSAENKSDVFVAVRNTTTEAEIRAALNVGKAVLCTYQNRVYYLSEDNVLTFRTAPDMQGNVYGLMVVDNRWTGITSYLAPTSSIPTVPIKNIKVNGNIITPQNDIVDIEVPTDYIDHETFEDRTNPMNIELSYSNGVLAFEESRVSLASLIPAFLNNCNVWFRLPAAYITGSQNETYVLRFWQTGGNMGTSAPTISLASVYNGKIYYATLSPVSEYRMEGQMQIYNLSVGT